MRKYVYFLVLSAVVALSACGGESTTKTGTTDSTNTVVTDTTSTHVDSSKVSVDTSAH